jgi:uncharacterized protein (TIGR03083 family)
MDQQTLWKAIDRQRQLAVDIVRDLSAQEWEAQSLCDLWKVRDVAAHLTFPLMGVPQMAAMALRSPRAAVAGTNALIAQGAVSIARRHSRDEITDRMQRTVGGRRTMPGLGVEEMLVDILGHGFDITAPLGRPYPTVVDDLVVAADHVIGYHGNKYSKVFEQLPLDGLRLSAVDTRWTHGRGAEVRGSMADLYLLLVGRTPGLATLTGDGADELRSRVGQRLTAAR